MAYDTVIVEHRGKVGLITLNRPDALNALNTQLVSELMSALNDLQDDEAVGCIVITGSESVFAAGADIKEMQEKTYLEAYSDDFIAPWDQISKIKKPIIAAVAGHALGGGCELAMMCDFIIAAENAKFGQPEIQLGIMPGIGGTQRLIRLVGKSKAMDMCLSGKVMLADEAERSGLVARVVPTNEYLDVALGVADKISEFSKPIVAMTKDTINRAYETTLSEGIRHERQVFYSMFATEDQKEGMTAFIEKRSAKFKDQ